MIADGGEAIADIDVKSQDGPADIDAARTWACG